MLWSQRTGLWGDKKLYLKCILFAGVTEPKTSRHTQNTCWHRHDGVVLKRRYTVYKILVLATIFGIGVQIPMPEPSPSVNGVQLNQSTEQVLLALGNPQSQDHHSYNSCDSEHNNTQWHYEGMSITFTEQQHQATVSQIEIYQGQWALDGIQLNDSVHKVKDIFGEADFIHDVLPYHNRGEASWEFTIRNNQVAQITLKQNHCRLSVWTPIKKASCNRLQDAFDD